MRRGESGINALVAVDKPLGCSSHDVVNRVRRAVGERRVGHAGTLDPAASGVLVVGIGQATRLSGLLTSEVKCYEASIRFGRETNTDDAEGEVTRAAEVPARLGEEAVAGVVVASLAGEHDQVPPAFSAISVNGKRAYKAAREGESLELEPRRVRVLSAELLRCRHEDGELVWDVALEVSKGFYVRSLARDLGRSLGSAAHLCALRRTRAGNVTLDQCTSLERLAELGATGLSRVALDPVAALGLPVRQLVGEELDDVACGRRIRAAAQGVVPYEDGSSVCLVHDGRLMGVWRVGGRALVPQVSFPSGIEGVRAR